MRAYILENLTNTESLDLAVILLNNTVSLVMAFFIMFTYKISYTGSAYSRRFNVAIGSITLITTMIMSVISNNVALSLGMVGALSIIRFRTAVKDVRDATYIFWAIAVGIGCGVSQYALIAIGSVFLLVFLQLTSRGFTSYRQMLVVQGESEALSAKRKIGTSLLWLRLYSVPEGMLERGAQKNQMDITEALIRIPGVNRVNLVEQKDELSQ